MKWLYVIFRNCFFMKQRKVWKNMKLSVELYTLSKRFGDCEAIKLTKKCGFDAIDYSYYWDKEKEVLGENYREFAQNIRKCLEENDMYCNQAHAPFSFAYENKMDISDEKYLWLVRSLESAAILGAENIVVHSVNVPTGVDFEEYNTKFGKLNLYSSDLLTLLQSRVQKYYQLVDKDIVVPTSVNIKKISEWNKKLLIQAVSYLLLEELAVHYLT